MDNLRILLHYLNPYCARAFQDAVVLCQSRTHKEVQPEHWLLKLLEQGEGDLSVVSRRNGCNTDTLCQMLQTWIDALPRSAGQQPRIPESILSLIQDAWLLATRAGETHIRGLYLLMVLIDNPHLLRCDSLKPLLAMGQIHLTQMLPLSDSDEQPDVQRVEAALQFSRDRVEFVGRAVEPGTHDNASCQLPDRAVCLTDAAGARWRMCSDVLPHIITRLKVLLTALGIEAQELLEGTVLHSGSDRLAMIDTLRKGLEEELEMLESYLHTEQDREQ